MYEYVSTPVVWFDEPVSALTVIELYVPVIAIEQLLPRGGFAAWPPRPGGLAGDPHEQGFGRANDRQSLRQPPRRKSHSS